MPNDLVERRRVLDACRTAILHRDKLFAAIAAASSATDLIGIVQREFDLTSVQAEAVLNLQTRHFSPVYVARLEKQIAAMDDTTASE